MAERVANVTVINNVAVNFRTVKKIQR